MVTNKFLKQWISMKYPLIRFESDSDLCELDYNDMQEFADHLVRKLDPGDIVTEITNEAVRGLRGFERFNMQNRLGEIKRNRGL